MKGPTMWDIALAVGLISWMNLSSFHELHYADSLVPVLTSLQRWTPFFWDQERFGMLVPLLAIPIAHPLGNLLAQCAATMAAAWMTLYLSVGYMLRRGESPRILFVAGALLILTALPPTQRFEVFGLSQPYNVSMALTLAGLWLLRGVYERGNALSQWPKTIAAGALMLLGAYVNVGVILATGPLVWLRTWSAGEGPKASARHLREAAVASALLIVAFVGSSYASRLATRRLGELPVGQVITGTRFGLTEWTGWPEAWATFWMTIHKRLARESAWELMIATAVLVGLLALVVPRVRQAGQASIRAALALMAAGIVCFLATGLSSHVAHNRFQIRYAVPALMLVTMGAGALLGTMMLTLPSAARKAVHKGAPLVLILAVAANYGRPGLDVVRSGFDRVWGPAARELVSYNADFMAGDYWTVWPTVFYSLQLCHDRGMPCGIRGLSLRSQPTLLRAPVTPGATLRIGAARGDAEAEPMVRRLLGPFTIVSDREGAVLRTFSIRVEPSIVLPGR